MHFLQNRLHWKQLALAVQLLELLVVWLLVLPPPPLVLLQVDRLQLSQLQFALQVERAALQKLSGPLPQPSLLQQPWLLVPLLQLPSLQFPLLILPALQLTLLQLPAPLFAPQQTPPLSLLSLPRQPLARLQLLPLHPRPLSLQLPLYQQQP